MSIDTVTYAYSVLAVMIEQADDEGIWTGRLTEIISEIATVSHYSAIVNVLRSAGAIEQVKRGGIGPLGVDDREPRRRPISGITVAVTALAPKSINDRVGALEQKVDQMMVDHLNQHHGSSGLLWVEDDKERESADAEVARLIEEEADAGEDS